MKKERPYNPDRHRYWVAEKLFPLTQGISVLELGGGNGEFSDRMVAKGIRVTFIDKDESAVRRAEKKGLAAYQLDLNSGLPPLQTESFDGAVLLDVIEHVMNAEYLLGEIFRVLRPGGFLILSTPNFAYLYNRLRVLCGKLFYDEGYHCRFFTVKTLSRKLNEAGFRIEKTAHTTPFLGINLVVNKIFKKPRIHIRVSDRLASLLALKLILRAVRTEKEIK